MKEVQPAEVKSLQDSGHTYLDVRTPEEFAAGSVPDSINIPVMLSLSGQMAPNSEFVGQVLEKLPDKSKPLLVGCKAGPRAAKALGLLEGEGYTDLTNVKGGYDAWSAM